jgi:hypothetical protein
MERHKLGLSQLYFLKCILILLGLQVFAHPFFPQSTSKTLNPKEIRQTVKAIARVFEEKYIFVNEGNKIAEFLRQKLLEGEYNELNQGPELARHLQEDARSVNQDRHIAIYYAPDRINAMQDPELQRKQKENSLLKARMNNHGFEEIRILPGNIGYLKLNSFSSTKAAFETAVAVMQFLSNSDAVIIDLRWNPGGESSMVQFICSYFLGDDPELLDVFHFREGHRVKQIWSLPYVPGQKLEHTDLYILTSGLTFSAAEGMAYDLKALKRAIVVGEISMGGAHPVDKVTVKDKFIVNIPYAFSKNPITQDNFEGKGVKPDVEIISENALSKAHSLALEKRIAAENNETAKTALKWAADGICSQSISLSEHVKKFYAGNYGPYKIHYENGFLYFQFGPGKLRMTPITEDYFKIENVNLFRVKIILRHELVEGIEVIYESGNSEAFSRN